MLHRLMLPLILVACLSGCYQNAYREERMPVLPPELVDCKIYTITVKNVGPVVMARCPNSTTAVQYKSDKTTRTTIIVDGVEYVPKSKEGDYDAR